MQRLHRPAVAAIALLVFASFCFAQAPTTRPARTAAEDSRFVRFVKDGDGGVLQTSILRYRNADGVVVDLIGAVHIADQAYFDALNDRFDDYDAVLYEMVRPRDAVPGARDRDAAPARAPRGARGMGMVGTLQRFMRDHLELEYQLDAIDYDRANFVHADLDLETFLAMQEERGESIFRLMLNAMMREMRRGPNPNQPNAFELLAAMQAPDRARALKLVFARQLSQMDDLLASLEGPRGSVILTERNKAAMDVVRERIEMGETSLAVFYGAGHLPGMEQILIDEMNFTADGEPQWITAWDLTVADEPATVPAR